MFCSACGTWFGTFVTVYAVRTVLYKFTYLQVNSAWSSSGVGSLSTGKSWWVNWHAMWCTSPIYVVIICKLVSGGALRELRSPLLYGAARLRIGLLFCNASFPGCTCISWCFCKGVQAEMELLKQCCYMLVAVPNAQQHYSTEGNFCTSVLLVWIFDL